MSDLVAVSNAAADAAGIPRQLLLACGVAESNLRADARRPTDPSKDAAYWPDCSFGAWQQTVRWSAEYLKERSKSGADAAAFPGSGTIETIGQSYTDPEYAAEVAAANLKGKYRGGEPDAVFKALCRYNYPAGDGTPADAATAANYRRGIIEAERLLGTATNDATNATNRVAYNPDATVDPQPDDFSCALHSAQYLLRAIGRHPERAWLVGQLVGPLSAAPIISREYGLMDASGRQMAAWLQREYGDEMGVTFAARPVNTWEDLVALAGKGPLMLGGRTFGHWVGVRAYRDGKVLLANPAGSWKGVGQELTRDEFDALGSWSAVTATLPAPGVGSGPSSQNDEDTILGLRTALAHVCDVEAPRLAAAAAERDKALATIKSIREQYLGEKP